MRNSLFIFLIAFVICSCSKQEARRPVQVKTHTTLAAATTNLKKLNLLEDKKIEAYIQLDSTQNYINSKNGFWYTYLSKSTQNRLPIPGETVTFTLEILDLSNQIIYTEKDLGEQIYKVDQQEIITGLQLGIKLLTQGDKVKFLIPAYNAYGVIGDQNKIGANQSIIAIITLQTIK